MRDDEPSAEQSQDDVRNPTALYDALCAYADIPHARDTDTLMLTCGAAIEYVVAIAKTHKMEPRDVIGLVHAVWEQVPDDESVRIK